PVTAKSRQWSEKKRSRAAGRRGRNTSTSRSTRSAQSKYIDQIEAKYCSRDGTSDVVQWLSQDYGLWPSDDEGLPQPGDSHTEQRERVPVAAPPVKKKRRSSRNVLLVVGEATATSETQGKRVRQ
ncbi:unnamed protein product, partial [Chrysoparadoxa australica]